MMAQKQGTKILSVAAALLFDSISAGRGQIIVGLQDLDEDNQPEAPSTSQTVQAPFTSQTVQRGGGGDIVETVRSVLMFVLSLVVLAVVAFILYRVYKWYQSTKQESSGSSSKQSLKKNASQKNSVGAFNIFNDEETAASDQGSRMNTGNVGSKSLGDLFKIGRDKSVSQPPTPPKKTFGQKVKGLFGKKSDSGAK